LYFWVPTYHFETLGWPLSPSYSRFCHRPVCDITHGQFGMTVSVLNAVGKGFGHSLQNCISGLEYHIFRYENTHLHHLTPCPSAVPSAMSPVACSVAPALTRGRRRKGPIDSSKILFLHRVDISFDCGTLTFITSPQAVPPSCVQCSSAVPGSISRRPREGSDGFFLNSILGQGQYILQSWNTHFHHRSSGSSAVLCATFVGGTGIDINFKTAQEGSDAFFQNSVFGQGQYIL
jgi:hypothetical protein